MLVVILLVVFMQFRPIMNNLTWLKLLNVILYNTDQIRVLVIGGSRGGGGVQGVRTPPFFSKILGIDFYSGFRRNAQHRLL